MSRISLATILLLCISSSGATQPRETVRIVTHAITHYERGTRVDPGFELEASYPELRVRHGDSALSAFRDSLSRAVLAFTGGITDHNDNGKHFSSREPFDDPFRNSLTYESYISDSVISVTLLTYEHGCCGASGSAEGWQCFNFDRSQRRMLRLGDVVKPGQWAALRPLVLDPANRDLSTEIFDTDSADFTYDSSSTDFGITDSTLLFYIPRSGGGRSWYMAVGVSIDQHPEIFTSLLYSRKRRQH